jgi:hypothetical protein
MQTLRSRIEGPNIKAIALYVPGATLPRYCGREEDERTRLSQRLNKTAATIARQMLGYFHAYRQIVGAPKF